MTEHEYECSLCGKYGLHQCPGGYCMGDVRRHIGASRAFPGLVEPWKGMGKTTDPWWLQRSRKKNMNNDKNDAFVAMTIALLMPLFVLGVLALVRGCL